LSNEVLFWLTCTVVRVTVEKFNKNLLWFANNQQKILCLHSFHCIQRPQKSTPANTLLPNSLKTHRNRPFPPVTQNQTQKSRIRSALDCNGAFLWPPTVNKCLRDGLNNAFCCSKVSKRKFFKVLIERNCRLSFWSGWILSLEHCELVFLWVEFWIGFFGQSWFCAVLKIDKKNWRTVFLG
jgi:hypothetical protein